jgi:8-oxo-dGTP pyrophosphatase MutT (NUDIX family)
MLLKRLCKKICRQKPLREVVLVFPYNSERREILIINEFIHHYDRSFWKFVSGGIDKKDTDNFTHAREELAEELGMEAEKFYHLYSSEKVFGARGLHAYIAENPKKMKNPPINPDTDIITETRWVNEGELHRMIDTKEMLWNESSLMALQVFRAYQNK